MESRNFLIEHSPAIVFWALMFGIACLVFLTGYIIYVKWSQKRWRNPTENYSSQTLNVLVNDLDNGPDDQRKNIHYGLNKIPISKEKRFIFYLVWTICFLILFFYSENNLFPKPQWLEYQNILYFSYSLIFTLYLLLFRQFVEKSPSYKYDGILLVILMSSLFVYEYTRPNATFLKPNDLSFNYSHANKLISYKKYNYYKDQPVIIIDGFSFDSAENITADKGRIGILKKLVKGQVLSVEWLPQTWTSFPFFWKKINLGIFEANIYVDHILPLTSYDNYLEIKEKM